MEIKLPHFTQSGRISISVHYDKTHIYIVMCRAATTKTLPRDTLKSTDHKARWNPERSIPRNILFNVLKCTIVIFHFDDKFVPNMAMAAPSFCLLFPFHLPLPPFFVSISLLSSKGYFRHNFHYPPPKQQSCLCLPQSTLSPWKPGSRYWGMKFKSQDLSGICHCDWGVMASRPIQ